MSEARQAARDEAGKLLRRHGLLIKGRILYIKPLTEAALAAGVVKAAEAYTGKMHTIRERPGTKGGIWEPPVSRLGVVHFSNGQTREEKRVDVAVRNPENRKSPFERLHPIGLQYGLGKSRLKLGLSLDEAVSLIEGLTAAVDTVAQERE